MERKGVITADDILVDHVHQTRQRSERGRLVETIHSERATGDAPLNVLLILTKMYAGLSLQAADLIGEDSDDDYITAMLDQYHINYQLVQRTSSVPTSVTQVMTSADGQCTLFHSPGADRLLNLPTFEPPGTPLKIFHLSYLLLLENLDRSNEALGTRSARLLAQMRDRGYGLSLDLASYKDDSYYRPQVLPALARLGYPTINELEASEFGGLGIRLPNGEPYVANIARAASTLLDAGMRQRAVIHCPEGVWDVPHTKVGHWVPSWRLPPEKIIGSVRAKDASYADLLYGNHERWPSTDNLQLTHACARADLQAMNMIDGVKTFPELQAFIRLQNGQTR